jgi:low temperature requirement protein LtrA
MIGWIRAARHVPTFRPTALRFVAGFAITTAIILASLTVGPDLRLVMWAVAVLIDIATPAFTLRQQLVLPPISSDRFPERFGLFTLIVLGESIIGVINGLSDLSAKGELAGAAFVSAPLGLAIGFGLWWIYFDFIARRPPRPVVTTTLGWVYLHLVLATMITITGAGISLALADQAVGGADASGQHLLATGVGGSLIAVALLEMTLAREHDEPTHELVSPGLKIASGLIALAAGWLPVTWPVIPLFVVLLATLAGPACYGVHVWFKRGPGLEDPVPAEPTG